jgi:hypothetical protein
MAHQSSWDQALAQLHAAEFDNLDAEMAALFPPPESSTSDTSDSSSLSNNASEQQVPYTHPIHLSEGADSEDEDEPETVERDANMDWGYLAHHAVNANSDAHSDTEDSDSNSNVFDPDDFDSDVSNRTFDSSDADFVSQPLAQRLLQRPTSIPFMDLIPELRRNVYFHALVKDKPIVPVELCPSKSIAIQNTFALMSNSDTWARRRQPALLRTNSQIRSEALPLYYRENVFNVSGTILSAGCMYPMFRYPTPTLSTPLRNLRHIHMILTVVQMQPAEDGPRSRVIMSLAVEVSLRYQGTKIRLMVVAGPAERTKHGKRHGIIIIGKDVIMEGYRKWLEEAVEGRLGDKDQDARWDGHNLLRAAAMMPVMLKCEQNPPWAKGVVEETANVASIRIARVNLLQVLGSRELIGEMSA